MYQFLCTVVAIWLIFSYVTQDIASSSDSSISNQVTSPKFVPSELPSAFENSLEKCVTLAFDDHPLSRGPAPKLAMVTDDKKKSVDWDSIVCKDILRMVNVYRRDNGYLPSYYVEALEKVPKFKNDKYALNRFLCRMDPHNNYLGVPCPDLFSGGLLPVSSRAGEDGEAPTFKEFSRFSYDLISCEKAEEIFMFPAFGRILWFTRFLV